MERAKNDTVEVRTVRGMLHHLYLVLCEKHYRLAGNTWTHINLVKDELLQFQSFFSDACQQSFQNLTIILRIDDLFLSLNIGWHTAYYRQGRINYRGNTV